MPEQKYKEFTSMIDHAVLHPTHTDEDLRVNCNLASELCAATICVKPYHTRLASKLLEHSQTKVCTVIGFPHGNSTILIKASECRKAIEDGAEEIDMVVNIAKVLESKWDYVKEELNSVISLCHSRNVICKVIFETDFLVQDHLKIKLCKLCGELGADYVKTSTGFGFVKGLDGRYSYIGATDHDVKLMIEHSPPTTKVKASGGIKDLDTLIHFKNLGVFRIGTSSTKLIADQAVARFQ